MEKAKVKRDRDDETVQVKVTRRIHRIIKLISVYRGIEMGDYVAELVERYGAPEVEKEAAAFKKKE